MSARRVPAAVLAVAVAGCNREHSVFAPQGAQAGQIADLTWLLLALVFAVALIVFSALAVAMRGPVQWRAGLAGTRAVAIGGIAFPAVTLSVLLAYGLWLMREAPAAAAPLRIEVIGEQWWWRVRYHTQDGGVIERANEIRMPAGTEVAFTLRSADVIHSFWIPALGGKVDMIPGRTNVLRLRAERPGIYRGICAEYCGGAHAFMMLDAVALPEADFALWLDRAAAAAAPGGEQERGGALFTAAGCASCHAIDGSAGAAGRIGPNLSEIGARRFIGAGRLPMTPENLMRFIADSPSLKPGSAMPPFRIFSDDELAAIAAYLSGLK